MADAYVGAMQKVLWSKADGGVELGLMEGLTCHLVRVGRRWYREGDEVWTYKVLVSELAAAIAEACSTISNSVYTVSVCQPSTLRKAEGLDYLLNSKSIAMLTDTTTDFETF